MVRAKTPGLQVVLHENFSSPVSAAHLVKSSKDSANVVVCTRKKFFGWECGFVVSDVISRLAEELWRC